MQFDCYNKYIAMGISLLFITCFEEWAGKGHGHLDASPINVANSLNSITLLTPQQCEIILAIKINGICIQRNCNNEYLYVYFIVSLLNCTI